jgi:hypothetical protein
MHHTHTITIYVNRSRVIQTPNPTAPIYHYSFPTLIPTPMVIRITDRINRNPRHPHHDPIHLTYPIFSPPFATTLSLPAINRFHGNTLQIPKPENRTRFLTKNIHHIAQTKPTTTSECYSETNTDLKSITLAFLSTSWTQTSTRSDKHLSIPIATHFNNTRSNWEAVS